MKILFPLCLLAFPIGLSAQHSSNRSFSFAKGVYIRSSEVLIPWGTNFSEIKEYGNPKILCSNKMNTKVSWDSIYILDSIKISFWTFYWRCFEKHKPTGKLTSMYGSIDSTDIPKIKSIMDKYANSQLTFSTHKNHYTYQWLIDDCIIKLGFDKRYGAFLNVQTHNKSFWK